MSLSDKLDLATEYFSGVFGAAASRSSRLNLEEMELPALSAIQAREIEAPFSREEVKKIVMEMPSDRASGPDGFSGLFFKLC
jgi:hypothetical protein